MQPCPVSFACSSLDHSECISARLGAQIVKPPQPLPMPGSDP